VLEVVEQISTWTRTAVPVDFTYIDPDWENAVIAGTREYVDQLVERLRARDVGATGFATLGEVSTTIAQTARDISADVIVMSTRGRTGPARAVLGSVADAVVRHARPPVVLVPQERGSSFVAGPRPRTGRACGDNGVI
jgi:nucleotide-binding universal stress UspA family protein